jgi:hypothetical protein
MEHQCVFATKEARQELGRRLGLTDGPEDRWLWRVTDFLLFGTVRDQDTGELLLSKSILADLCLRPVTSGAFSAFDALAQYQTRTGVILDVSLPDALQGKARVLKNATFPEGVAEVADQIRQPTTALQDRVQLDTAIPWRPETARRQRLTSREEAMSRIAEAHNHDAERLLRLLNGNSGNRWTETKKHLARLRSSANELPPGSREFALNTLARTESQPMPYFVPVAKTSRVYPIGPSLLQLPRGLRKELVHSLGWRVLDLRHAQLAIIAKIWNVPVLQNYLESDRSFWTDQLSHLGLDEAQKPLLKNALYALIFGEGDRNAKERFRTTLGPRGSRIYKRWRSDPLIAALHEARTVEMHRVAAAGFAIDAYGRKWTVPTWTSENDRGQAFPASEVRSVLATVAQSFELYLLAPILDIVEREDGRLRLMVWLHDGLTVSVPKNRMHVLNWMKASVNERAALLGIHTTLEEEE